MATTTRTQSAMIMHRSARQGRGVRDHRVIPPRRGAVLALMCAGMFLVLLDVTIVNVALPSIGSGLGTGVAGLQWVVDGYAVTIASLLLAGGTVGDRIGHRRVLLIGFAVFGVASLGCATAPSVALLVLSRVVQGTGGALLLPSTMAVIADSYPDAGEQARALGIWAAASSLALPAGPLLGGVLVDSVGWRWVFWINVPLTAAIVVASRAVVPRARPSRSGQFDAVGLACFVAALAGLVFAVISAGRGAPLTEWLTAALIAAGAAAAGLRQETRAPNPVLPVDLLRRGQFLSPNVVAWTMNTAFNGTLFLTTLYLQDIRGYSAVVSGTLVLPMAVPLVLLAPVSGRITAARGPRTAVSAGCIVAAAGAAVLVTVPVHGQLATLLVGLGVLGCGAGLITASVVAAVVRATPKDRSGLATGVSNTARQVGTACGVAIFGAVAGEPRHSGTFVAGVHTLAIASVAAWLIAAVIAVRGIATIGQPVGRAD